MPDGRWEGGDGAHWARVLGVPVVEAHAEVGSTNDRAHALAQAGAPALALVVADAQVAGRGRLGRTWASLPGHGVWASVVTRPPDADTVAVLAIRVGLRLAAHLAALADAPVTLKWPNDVFAGDGKVAGVLCEGRWQGATPSWVVVGIGVNARPPDATPEAAGIAVPRPVLLAAIVDAVREATRGRGSLSAAEGAAWAARDRLAGRRIVAPGAGVVHGIAPDGALQVRGDDGLATFHAGSVVLA